VRQGPEGPTAKREPSPVGLGINPNDDPERRRRGTIMYGLQSPRANCRSWSCLEFRSLWQWCFCFQAARAVQPCGVEGHSG
jgi:hypothetical protein